MDSSSGDTTLDILSSLSELENKSSTTRNSKPDTRFSAPYTANAQPNGAPTPTEEVTRTTKRSRKPSFDDKNIKRLKQDGPTFSMRQAVRKSLKKIVGTGVEEFVDNIEEQMFQLYPPFPSSSSFSPLYLSRLRALQNNAKAVAHLLKSSLLSDRMHTPLTGKASLAGSENHTQRMIRHIVQCPVEELLLPEDVLRKRSEMETALREKITHENTQCPRCGKTNKALLNLNLMALEENNHWSSMFEDDMCSCTVESP